MITAIAAPSARTWVPDYLYGSLKHWQAPIGSFVPEQPYQGSQQIHCVSRWQHIIDGLLGRPPRARCGAVLAAEGASALFDDGAPLCPKCAACAHPPTDQVELFNRRGHHRHCAR